MILAPKIFDFSISKKNLKRTNEKLKIKSVRKKDSSEVREGSERPNDILKNQNDGALSLSLLFYNSTYFSFLPLLSHNSKIPLSSSLESQFEWSISLLMADQENSVRVTRAAAKKRAASGSASEQPAKKKRVVLGELPTNTNVVVSVNPSLKAESRKAKAKAKKALLTEKTKAKTKATEDADIDIDARSDDPQICGAYVTDIYQYLHSMEVNKKEKNWSFGSFLGLISFASVISCFVNKFNFSDNVGGSKEKAFAWLRREGSEGCECKHERGIGWLVGGGCGGIQAYFRHPLSHHFVYW